MADLTEKLHDGIDEMEEAVSKAGEVVDSVKKRTVEIAANINSLDDIFEAIALIVEDGLTDTTSEAARVGFATGRKIKNA